jgi:hypothetical protein
LGIKVIISAFICNCFARITLPSDKMTKYKIQEGKRKIDRGKGEKGIGGIEV